MRYPVGSYVRIRDLDEHDGLYSSGARDFIGRVGRVKDKRGYCLSLGDSQRPRTVISYFWNDSDRTKYELYDDDLEPATREEWELQTLLDRITQ
jgi:hypothetical protein